ncbi:hypothetical protein HF086_017566 [Spodoptera exigua]|uniref:Uncharacterized protein n=1 Tax=Spodoptera exigua TaxID=7107 RepID=A0A922SP34_SPOEX|nr:hypothetical protein HF086_017566 [Spodoptera exigua]
MSYSPSILDIGELNRFVFDNVDSQITTPLNEVDQTEIQEPNSEDLQEANYKTYFENLTNQQHLPVKDSQNNQAQSFKKTKKRKLDTSLSYVIRNEPGKCHHLINIAVYDLGGDTVPGINYCENNNARVSVQYLVKDYCDDIMDEIEYLIGKIVKKISLSNQQ